MLTAPQSRLLREFGFKPKMNKYHLAKSGLGSEKSKTADYPVRSGNLETPVKPKHKGLMGQPDNPHQTRAQKPGRPPASRTRPEGSSSEDSGLSAQADIFRDDPSGLTDMGEPLTRGLSQQMVGDDAEMHPSKGIAPTEVRGPSETPGKAKNTGLGLRFKRTSI